MTGSPAPPVAAPLTPGEQALWLLQRLAPDRGTTNVAMRVDLPGAPRWWPLRETVRWLVARHPALRSCFPMRDAAPVRVVHPPDQVDVDLDVVDVPPGELARALRDYAARPFDLTRPPLARVALFRAGPERQYLCLVAHHIVVDAASLGLLLGEIAAGYDAVAGSGEPPRLPAPVPVAPAPPREESLRYWRERLAGFDPAGMRLEPGREPEGAPTFAGDEVGRTYPVELTEAVDALRPRCRATDAALWLSAYLLALRAHGAADDAVVGTMVSTRGTAHAASVGYRVATVPLRMSIDPAASFPALAADVGGRLMAAVEHADVPFEMLVPELGAVDGDPLWWRHGLVRHTFNYRLPPTLPGDGQRRLSDVPTGLARFDLELTVERFAGRFVVRLVHSTEVHDRAVAEAILDRMAAVLTQAAAAPERAVGEFDLRTRAEIELLDALNDTSVRWDGPATVPELIAAVAAATPDAIAVTDGDRQVSYRELTAAAGTVARMLAEHRVAAGDLVGVAGPRSPELAAAVLGVWSVGAAYLPVDAEHPAHRLRHQLADAGCRIVLDGDSLPEDARAGRTCLAVPRVAAAAQATGMAATAAPAGTPGPAVAHRVAAEDLAYLIYTSGSTGPPKGVRLTHGNLTNLVRHFARLLAADDSTVMLWMTTFAFDISALELCLPLVTGGRVVVAPDPVRAIPERLLDLIARAEVSVVQTTPTTWRMVVPIAGDRLARCDVLCGGEPLPPALARALRRTSRRAFNVYGPTETTIWSTVAELTAAEDDRVTVGRPIANTRAYVLDGAGRPRAAGVAGELCLAGDGLAQGYHRQPELTAQRFPVGEGIGRYYRTGDLARLLADGRIEVLGRRDRQIKLRAHRIELTEVESVLAEHDEVRAAAVVLHGDPVGDGYLAAYVVAQERAGLAVDVWSFARSRLPAYSLPGRVTVVPALPETPNGKVDVARLATARPDPGPAVASPPGPPVDGVHQRLVEVWREVLGRHRIDQHANFFLNGGTSIMAVRLAETASQRCGVPVTMGMIFRAPTPAALADLLAEPGPSVAPGSLTEHRR